MVRRRGTGRAVGGARVSKYLTRKHLVLEGRWDQETVVASVKVYTDFGQEPKARLKLVLPII